MKWWWFKQRSFLEEEKKWRKTRCTWLLATLFLEEKDNSFGSINPSKQILIGHNKGQFHLNIGPFHGCYSSGNGISVSFTPTHLHVHAPDLDLIKASILSHTWSAAARSWCLLFLLIWVSISESGRIGVIFPLKYFVDYRDLRNNDNGHRPRLSSHSISSRFSLIPHYRPQIAQRNLQLKQRRDFNSTIDSV